MRVDFVRCSALVELPWRLAVRSGPVVITIDDVAALFALGLDVKFVHDVYGGTGLVLDYPEEERV